eukprot:1161767-Pelagomonas_calceolata.AAC.2
MGGAAGMRGIQHPHMMAAGPGVRGGPMGFNNPMGAAAVGGRGGGGMGRGGVMGGAAGRGGGGGGGGGFRPQLNSGLRAPFLSPGPGGAAGMMGRPMAPPAPHANMRPHPSMLAQVRRFFPSLFGCRAMVCGLILIPPLALCIFHAWKMAEGSALCAASASLCVDLA